MRKILILLLTLHGLTAKAGSVVYQTENPNVKVVLPPRDSLKAAYPRRCVVICPGGGYNHAAKDKETDDWTEWFSARDIAVALLRYDLPNGNRDVPLGELSDLFDLLRRNAKSWNINPRDIGIMGFSAGGHLATAFTTHCDEQRRPAFQILLYPVIRLNTKRHYGMARHFLGDDCTEAERDEWSSDRKVSADSPPAFIALSDDDPIIDPLNSIDYYTALRAHDVPASLHIYPSGGHGFGFESSFPYHNEMLSDMAAWLNSVRAVDGDALRWACIGNSITAGAGLRFPREESYPARMQQSLGSRYEVRNFGVSGRTMTTEGKGYMKEEAWRRVKAFHPDIVSIALGTNDSQKRWWHGVDTLIADYQAMIDTLRQLPSHPRIIILLPPKSYPSHYAVRDSMVLTVINPAIRRLAEKNSLEIIDLYPVLDGHEEWFHDHLHPNSDGARQIADYIVSHAAPPTDDDQKNSERLPARKTR